MSEDIRVAVIGLGEAGSLIAAGLIAAGADVVGFDPAGSLPNPPVPIAASVEAAAAGAQLVLSISSPTASRKAAEQLAPLLEAGAVYADLNTGTPAHKRTLAALFPEGAFADVAVMKPVPGLAEKVPLAVAGTGAHRFIELLEPFGMDLEFVSSRAGDAAARTLIRSMLTTGMAGVLIDCLWAAESMGIQAWAYQEILDEFDSSSSETAKSYLSGTAQHIKRRQIEMMDVVEMLNDTGYESSTAPAVGLNYSRILHGKKIPFSTIR
ncbi:hypothetical protein GCM10022381_28400 [Leifsonia kafniensis]|uniref:6-phosphogluconate dehydrogenase NADP-binding domain-containing protein n=1 Tax=Leifsonia kafniensis TaxID=475957 RepID=A0ABP7KPB1_9MICO